MKITGRELKYKGLIFKIWRETFEKNGKRMEREIVEFPETCAVLPILDKEHIILITQYRFPLKQNLLEIPAGKIEGDETPEEAARRELMEEIKMKPKKLLKLGSFYLTPGYSTEKIHLFVGSELEQEGLTEDEEEDITCHRISIETALEMVKKGEIEDAKTALALLLYLFSRDKI